MNSNMTANENVCKIRNLFDILLFSSKFVDIVLVTFVDIVFDIFVDILSVTFIISSRTITES